VAISSSREVDLDGTTIHHDSMNNDSSQLSEKFRTAVQHVTAMPLNCDSSGVV
jgi:hypothetical protein